MASDDVRRWYGPSKYAVNFRVNEFSAKLLSRV